MAAPCRHCGVRMVRVKLNGEPRLFCSRCAVFEPIPPSFATEKKPKRRLSNSLLQALADGQTKNQKAIDSKTNAVNYDNEEAPPGTMARIRIGDQEIAAFDAGAAGEEAAARTAAFNDTATAAIREHGYPAAANPDEINMPLVIGILTLLVLYVTMVYGPIAALLVELFPTRIRYSGMSLPYHIGNGWFGGFLPPTAFAIVAATGNIFSGLYYPIAIALLTFVIGMLCVPETKDRDIYADD